VPLIVHKNNQNNPKPEEYMARGRQSGFLVGPRQPNEAAAGKAWPGSSPEGGSNSGHSGLLASGNRLQRPDQLSPRAPRPMARNRSALCRRPITR